jgi:hypothetical protein
MGRKRLDEAGRDALLEADALPLYSDMVHNTKRPDDGVTLDDVVSQSLGRDVS